MKYYFLQCLKFKIIMNCNLTHLFLVGFNDLPVWMICNHNDIHIDGITFLWLAALSLLWRLNFDLCVLL